jgi:molybdopterin converting factor small subunit
METLEMIEEMLPRQLTVEEIDEAEKIILQRVQIVEFPDELKTVISQGTVVHKPVSLILG